MTPAQAITLVSLTAAVLLVLILAGWVWSLRRIHPPAHTGYVPGLDLIYEDDTPDEVGPAVADPVQRMLALMSSGEPYAAYGAQTVHRACLADRREGRPPCAECEPIFGAVSS